MTFERAHGAPAAPCAICNLREPGERLTGVTRWRVRPHPEPVPMAGWLIVDLDRHAEGWHAIDSDEASEFGHLMQRLSSALREASGAERIYLLSFTEMVPHLHAHLAPRHGSDPGQRGWGIADRYRAVAEGRAEPADAMAHARICRAAIERVNATHA
ncbi:MAG: hypothetical protein KF724_05640 [Phycisphaeraceae bacterium]|nr:hypothetical protein [Phycisphaeraceae bacterium]